jgi:3-deoxy-D-manno-octulosonic-acid transferase
VRRFFNRFDLAYMSIMPLAGAMMAYKMWRKKKYRESAPAMLGLRLKDEDPEPWENGCVWVHAVSVGEVIAARAMLPLLREHFAPLPILLTTHTETGQAAARARPAGMADAVRYYPLDFSWIVQHYVDLFKPKVFIPMETELWPNALDILAKSGARIFTLNGKISEKSYKSYQRLGGLIRRPLSRITAFCVQTEMDGQRIAHLLGKAENIHVTGNCKFDVDFPVVDDEAKVRVAQELEMAWPGRWIIAGSTHQGEEQILLRAMAEVWEKLPTVQLALVPRHPERFQEVWNLLVQSGIPAMRASDGARTKEAAPRVQLIDKMGVLTRLYALGEVAVVAGSFVPGIGGHNLLEAAAQAVPVVYGPYMKSQPDMARILSTENGGTVAAPENLGAALLDLLKSPADSKTKGEAGKKAYEANRGSALRNMEIIRQYYPGTH